MAKQKRKNGEGTVRLRKDGRWEGRVVIGYDDKGKPKTKSVLAHTKSECVEKLEMLKEECGRTAEKLKPDMPFGEWIDFWYKYFSSPKLRPTTQATYENRIYGHIIPSVGKIPLSKLTQNDLQQFYAKLKRTGRKVNVELKGSGVSDRMVRSCHALCRSSLEKAVEEGLITRNPSIGCKLPPKKNGEMKVLTQNEIVRLLNQAYDEGYYEMFLLELTTGMRRGEILGLKWRDLNLETGELNIKRQLTTKGISVPKTKSSIRTVLLPPDMLDLLREMKKTAKYDWIFPSPVKEGEPRNPTAITKRFRIMLERAHCKHVRFHDLRHTFATMALENGMDVKTLSAMIGHVSSETTLNIYSHVTDTMRAQAAVKIDREIGGTNAEMPKVKDEPRQPQTSEIEENFEPWKPKVRKSGTGCVYQINDHLWEGSYFPRLPDGSRKKFNVYAKTREECEAELAKMIEQKKKEISELKKKAKTA